MSARPDLDALIAAAKERVERMSPEEQEAMVKAQAESWARSMAPCEHGMVDWEQCPDCRRRHEMTEATAQGWRWVPEEPTMKMLSAAQMAWLNDPQRRSSTLYRAMLAAAPSAPVPQGGEPVAWRMLDCTTGAVRFTESQGTAEQFAAQSDWIVSPLFLAASAPPAAPAPQGGVEVFAESINRNIRIRSGKATKEEILHEASMLFLTIGTRPDKMSLLARELHEIAGALMDLVINAPPAAPADFELCHCELSSEVHIIRAGETGCELCNLAERLKPDADAVEGVLRGYQHRCSAAPADELVAKKLEIARRYWDAIFAVGLAQGSVEHDPDDAEARSELNRAEDARIDAEGDFINAFNGPDGYPMTAEELREAVARHRAQPAAPADELVRALEPFAKLIEGDEYNDVWSRDVVLLVIQGSEELGELPFGVFRSAAEALARYRAQPSDCCKRTLERAAEVAGAHKGSAAKKRQESKLVKLSNLSHEAQNEIIAEERGEDIAAEIIERAIRNLSTRKEPSHDR